MGLMRKKKPNIDILRWMKVVNCLLFAFHGKGAKACWANRDNIWRKSGEANKNGNEEYHRKNNVW